MPEPLVHTEVRAPLPQQWPKGYRPPGAAEPWKKGQSGNPSGKGAKFLAAQQICREASPEAAQTLVELMRDPDPRVRGYAADKVREWAWGKIPDYDPSKEQTNDLSLDPSALTPDQRQRFMQLLRLLLAATAAPNEIVIDGTNDGLAAAADNEAK